MLSLDRKFQSGIRYFINFGLFKLTTESALLYNPLCKKHQVKASKEDFG
jgi:hypothetical protein